MRTYDVMILNDFWCKSSRNSPFFVTENCANINFLFFSDLIKFDARVKHWQPICVHNSRRRQRGRLFKSDTGWANVPIVNSKRFALLPIGALEEKLLALCGFFRKFIPFSKCSPPQSHQLLYF